MYCSISFSEMTTRRRFATFDVCVIDVTEGEADSCRFECCVDVGLGRLIFNALSGRTILSTTPVSETLAAVRASAVLLVRLGFWLLAVLMRPE